MGLPAIEYPKGPWKKGQSGNPYGKPKLPEHLRLIKAFTSDEIARYIAKYGRFTIENLILTESDQNAPIIERILARMFREAFEAKPEFALPTLKFLLDRALGKVPDVVFSEPEDDAEREGLRKLTLEELLQLVRKIIPEAPSVPMSTEL